MATSKTKKTNSFNLGLSQRFALAGILPETVGSFAEMRKIRSLRERIQPSAETLTAIEFRPLPNGNFAWNGEKATEVLGDGDMDFDADEQRVIAESFLVMESKGEVPTDDAFALLYGQFEDVIASLDA